MLSLHGVERDRGRYVVDSAKVVISRAMRGT